jgi:hypothetical protein
VPAAWADFLAEKLGLHGIVFRRIDRPLAQAQVEVFRATKIEFKKPPFEGRTAPALTGQWQAEARDLPAGSLYVPVNQAGARLLIALLEPQSGDSYAAWGTFNNAFEQKEYMEPYVAEQVGERLLANDPKLAQEFRDKLDTDPAFEHDPQARLDFFYRRSPSWDERYGLYPVYRVQHDPG